MSDDNNIKLIENFKICTYKVVYDDNKLDEIISELKEKYFELKSEIIYSFHGIETIPDIFNQNLNEAIELLHVEEDLYNIESEYSVGLYGKKYNIAYKKYSLLYYLVNKKSSSIIFDLYDYINSIYKVYSNISGYFSDKPYIGPEELDIILSSITGHGKFVYDRYINIEEKDKYISDILSCIRLELIKSKEIKDNAEFKKVAEDTCKYIEVTSQKPIERDFKIGNVKTRRRNANDR